MPSGPYIILGHLSKLGHPDHLSHLGNIGDLDPLNPSTLDPVLTDSLPGAFITEMDPMDPGPSEGCYADDSLDPLHTRTLETVTQGRLPLGVTHKTEALNGHSPTSGIPIDALDGHSSLSEIYPEDTQADLNPYDSV
jgi:hypothetical protein